MKKSRYSEEQVAYAALGGIRDAGRRCLSPDGHRGSHLLPLEEEIRELGRGRGPRVAADARGECAPEATGGRPDARQADPPGGDPKKKSETSSQTGAGSVGAGPLPGELPARVRARPHLSE